MVARNGKSVMKLVRLPILIPLMRKRDIYIAMKELYHKISHLINSGLKIGNLTNINGQSLGNLLLDPQLL